MKKTLTLLISAALLIAGLAGIPAAADDNTAEPAPYFRSATGVVTDINEYYGVNETAVPDWYFIGIEDENGDPATLLVTDKTCYPFESEIAVGDIVTGYYPSDIPMIMIYPPQYPISVLVAGIPEIQSVKVDRFSTGGMAPEGFFISDDNMLAIRIGEVTEVIDVYGETFTGDLDGRSLVVVYDISTKSIPAQTTPLKIIVLAEGEEPTEEAPVSDEMPIIVNGTEIDAPIAFHDDGTVMVPLRAIAEALGFTVTWNGQTQGVDLDGKIKLAIGNNLYENDGVGFTLSSAPVLVNGSTFVPLRFFKDVAGMNNAYFFEGQIVIDRDGEIME